MNVEERNPLLVVDASGPDLIINVGRVTLGEENRDKLQKQEREEEKARVVQAACALLNSGGGVIQMEMTNRDEHPVEMGQDLEKALSMLIDPSNLQAFFEDKQQGGCAFLFVKSWSSDLCPEDHAFKPRICSLSSSLYGRSGTSLSLMGPRKAFDFLKSKKRNANKSSGEEPSSKVPRVMCPGLQKSDPASLIFQRQTLEYGEVLSFPESDGVEFKQFSTHNVIKYIESTVPKYVAAFANTKGGYLFIGVHDTTKRVIGCAKEIIERKKREIIEPVSLKMATERVIEKLPLSCFCQSKGKIHCTVKVLDVFKAGELYGYACAIRVEPFCCVVFSSAPNSWMVKDKELRKLSIEEWVDRVTDTDPALQRLCEDFESQLSLTKGTPLSRPVYTKKGLEHKEDLQRLLFAVPSDHLHYTPEYLWQELCSQNPGLEELVKKEMQHFSRGIVILSRSWAVDLNLPRKEGVICDALLVAQDSFPVLYTILRKQEATGYDYSNLTAFTLKTKLVGIGGYTWKACVMTKVLSLSPESTEEPLGGLGSRIEYPESYTLGDIQQMEDFLQSLVIVLLGFRSVLSDQLGCEVLNLLTAQQYKIFSKNIHRSRELFIHGLPGSGKTIMAMKALKTIRNIFHCQARNILYVCENQPLMRYLSDQMICESVTRKTFMRKDFPEIQHIVIDEAQNFLTEDGPWYRKAKIITQRQRDCPGILWIFLDYFQTIHLDASGLPPLEAQFPREELTKVVRNAGQIANYLQKKMDIVRRYPLPNVPPKSLEMICEAELVQAVGGTLKTEENLSQEVVVAKVADICKSLFEIGYSPKDIAVLVSTTKEVEGYKRELLEAMMKQRVVSFRDANNLSGDYIVLDSIRRFSGLERNIVFGIHPKTHEPILLDSILLCLASRAKQQLYLYMYSVNPQQSYWEGKQKMI
ncbi:schlafen family member 11 [Tenrec ecaudatus]|uniref:schlafen family member 11 n=1 Tax=Tenrec ecaudatus TaxID=94439 RepID=UPI003F5992DD